MNSHCIHEEMEYRDNRKLRNLFTTKTLGSDLCPFDFKTHVYFTSIWKENSSSIVKSSHFVLGEVAMEGQTQEKISWRSELHLGI